MKKSRSVKTIPYLSPQTMLQDSFPRSMGMWTVSGIRGTQLGIRALPRLLRKVLIARKADKADCQHMTSAP